MFEVRRGGLVLMVEKDFPIQVLIPFQVQYPQRFRGWTIFIIQGDLSSFVGASLSPGTPVSVTPLMRLEPSFVKVGLGSIDGIDNFLDVCHGGVVNNSSPDWWSIFHDVLVLLSCTGLSGVNEDMIPLQSMMDEIQRVLIPESFLSVLHIKVLEPLSHEELITQVHIETPVLQS